jgi:hypothetical protein
VGVFGDKALGSVGAGDIDVQGHIYIPASGHPAQAIAVGFCGTQGSTFFANTTDGNGYDSGYWLIYEHGTVGLNDDQANHDGSFQFVWATNDNMDALRTTALGSTMTRAALGISQNTWVTFQLTITPGSNLLVARINGVNVYSGVIPTGGPTTGAVQIGFRETGGGVAATEGTWIDGLAISGGGVPVTMSEFLVD